MLYQEGKAEDTTFVLGYCSPTRNTDSREVKAHSEDSEVSTKKIARLKPFPSGIAWSQSEHTSWEGKNLANVCSLINHARWCSEVTCSGARWTACKQQACRPDRPRCRESSCILFECSRRQYELFL